MNDKTLDTSNLGQWMGKRMEDAVSFEPVAGNDIGRWVQAMQYPNRLHCDHVYAAESRYGQMVGASVVHNHSR